jgi:hypothetical protein
VTRTIETTIDIDAPPHRVWAVLIDLERYPEWNPFTPRIDGRLDVGGRLVLHVAMDPGRPPILQAQRCTKVEAGRELAWTTVVGSPILLTAHRRQTLEPIGERRTRYWSADAFSGLLVPVVMGLYRARIQRGFEATAEALKRRAELLGPA